MAEAQEVAAVISPATTTLLAGAGCSGDQSGRGAAAAFAFPHSLALLSSGSEGSSSWLALADRGSNRLKFLGVGGAQHGHASVLAGTGLRSYVDGTCDTCGFNEPASVAASACGRVLFIADRENHCVRAVWVGASRPSAAAAAVGADGSDALPPPGVTGEASWLAARSGKLASTDSSSFMAAGSGGKRGEGGGRFTFTLAGGGTGGTGGAGLEDGSAAAARFNSPCCVAVEPLTGDIVVADEGNNRVRRIVLPRQPLDGGSAGAPSRSSSPSDPWAGFAAAAAAQLAGGAPVVTPWYALHGVTVETLVGGGVAGGMNLRRPHLIAPMRDGTLLVADHSAGLTQEHKQEDARFNGALLRIFPPLPSLPPPVTTATAAAREAAASVPQSRSRLEHRRRQAGASLHVRRVTEGCKLGLVSCVARGPSCSLLASAATAELQDEGTVTALVCERAGGSFIQLSLPHRDRMDLLSSDSDDSEAEEQGDGGAGGKTAAEEQLADSVARRIPLVASQPLIPRAMTPEPLSLLSGGQAITGIVVLEGGCEAADDVRVLLADTWRHRVLSVQLRGEPAVQDATLQAEATAKAARATNAPILLQPRAAVQRVQRLAPTVRCVRMGAFPSSWGPKMAGLARSISFSETNLLSSVNLSNATALAAAEAAATEAAAKQQQQQQQQQQPKELSQSRSVPVVGVSALRPAALPLARADEATAAGIGGGGGGGSAELDDSVMIPSGAATWVRDAASEAALRRAVAVGSTSVASNPFASPQKKQQPANMNSFSTLQLRSGSSNPFAASGTSKVDLEQDPEVTYMTSGGPGDFDFSTFRSDNDHDDMAANVEATACAAGAVQGAAAPAAAEEPLAESMEFSGDGDGIPASWTKGALLGSGAFGRVFLGLDISSGGFFALKEIEGGVVHTPGKERRSSDGGGEVVAVAAATAASGVPSNNMSMSLVPTRSSLKQQAVSSAQRTSTDGLIELQSEISILRSLRHENIVGYLGARISRGRKSVPRHREAIAEAAGGGGGSGGRGEVGGGDLLQIFLEYVPGGSLKSLLTSFGALPLSELGALRRYLHGLLSGLDFLHTRSPPVVHGDVKAANLLLDIGGKVKIADFGCACRMTTPSEKESGAETFADACDGVGIVGTVPWMAPEVAQEEGFGAKADIWSVGCTVIEMVTATRPWPRFEMQWALLLHLVSSEATPLDASAEGDGKATEGCIAALAPEAGSDLRDLASRCLQRDAAARWTCKQLLDHAFIQDAKLPDQS